MPRYKLVIDADHTGTAHSIEIDAATPWLALEKSQARLGWMSAEIFAGADCLARIEHLPMRKGGLWQIVPFVPPGANPSES